MISKERLEELIKQGATIWGVYDYSYSYDKPNKKVEFIDLDGFYNYYKDIDEFIMYQGDYSELFETEEEAKWFAEFGCIERTERLELPTWEELQNKREFYLGKKKAFMNRNIQHRNHLFLNYQQLILQLLLLTFLMIIFILVK